MDATKDYYAILGVLPSAEEIVVRAAFRALAQRYHPDRFEAAKSDSTRKMAEINEAYAVLSDPAQRKEYDKLRGSSTQSGESYFGDGSEDAPPQYDPLEQDWATAIKFYPDLPTIESRLTKIAWRLGYSFRAYMLEEKAFEQRRKVADAMEGNFLESYFGSNPKLLSFAKELIQRGQKQALRGLNEAVRILGSAVDADRVIAQIKKEHRHNEEAARLLGISYDGQRYRWREYSYDNLADAIAYAQRVSLDRDGFWGI